MSHLLCLPRELRDTIIDLVVKSERREPPIAHDDRDSSGAERVQHEDTYWKDVGNLIYFERSPAAFQPAYGGLLLTCQQLRAETLECASKVDVPYVLDLLLVNEDHIWVTWISMPAERTVMIEKLRINVRMQCDGYDWNNDAQGSGGSEKTGRFTTLLMTQMRNLLYRILAVGCAGALPHDNRQRLWMLARYEFKDTIRFEHEYIPHYTVRNLEFHFSDIIRSKMGRCHGPSPSLVACYAKQCQYTVDEMAGYYHAPFRYLYAHPGWETVQERVGRILIFQESELSHSVDMNTDYRNFSSTYRTNPDAADDWGRVLLVREANGL